MYVLNSMVHYDDESSKTTLIDANDKEHIKANAYMLPSMICE